LQNILRPRNYDILLYDIEMGADPDMFAYYHSSQIGDSGLNLSNYSSALADDILLSARSTKDIRLRQAKYEAFIRQWLEDVPAIGIYQVNMTYFYNHSVRSFSDQEKLVTSIDRFGDVLYWAVNQKTTFRTP
jgi:ABC-type transport system substrate-binding protein